MSNKNSIVLLSLFLSLFINLNAHAENPCAIGNGGIGGTGITLEHGIGGTGISPENGLGGTGITPQNGLGGTGQKLSLVGVVTGFASICVNGVEVHYDNDTTIAVNGLNTSPEQLTIGQMVSVEAVKTPNGWNANSIQTNDAVSGPVTQINSNNSIVVAGQSVKLYKPGKFQLGQHIKVQGIRNVNNEILATDTRPANSAEILITGIPERGVDGRSRIGGLEISNAQTHALSPGKPVSITGHLNGNSLQVTHARPINTAHQRSQLLSVQGLVKNVDSNGITLTDGTRVNARQRPAPGSIVRITARKDTNGTWVSDSVNIQQHSDLMTRAGKYLDAQQTKIHRKENDDDDRENEDSNSGKNKSDEDKEDKNKSSNSGKGKSDLEDDSNKTKIEINTVVDKKLENSDNMEIKYRSIGNSMKVIESIESNNREVRPDKIERVDSDRSGSGKDRIKMDDRENRSRDRIRSNERVDSSGRGRGRGRGGD